MSLEESMNTLAESNLKLAAAMSHYASVMQAVAAGNPTAVVAPSNPPAATDATPEKAKGKGGRKSNAEKEAEAAAKAADNGEADPFNDGGEADPFADDEPATPALTAEVIRGLVLKVKEKNKDHAMGLLKKLGVSTLGQIKEEDYPKVVELAAKVGVTL